MNDMGEFIRKLLEAVAEWFRRCLPEYDPASWNDANGIQYNNNCYNYACNIQTGTYAQPGRASGFILNQSHYHCDGVQGAVWNAAATDGLVPVECNTSCGCSKCWHKVALAIRPGRDYHWYRQDRDGTWSHKPGGGPATNLDNSNNVITDPATADRGNYTSFCGCFCVCRSDVTIS
jgi:hypothetical protein